MFFVRLTTFLWLLKDYECNLIAPKKDYFVTPQAISSIFEEICPNCNAEIYVSFSSSGKLSKAFVSNIIKNFKFPAQVESKLKVLKDRRRFYFLICVDSLDGFFRIYEQMTVEKFYFNGFFIVFFPNATFSDMNKIFELLWKMFVFNVIIINESGEVFTFMPFGKLGNCSDVTPVEINNFNRESSEWTSKNFFPRKFTNLNKCPIKCGVFNLIPAIIITRHSDGSVALSGFDVDTFNELMKSINAEVKYTVYPVDTGTFYSNGTGTGLLGRTLRGEISIFL